MKVKSTVPKENLASSLELDDVLRVLDTAVGLDVVAVTRGEHALNTVMKLRALSENLDVSINHSTQAQTIIINAC